MVSTKKLCKSCKKQTCCTDSAVPLVFSQDYLDLKSIGKDGKEFLMNIKINGKKVNAIKKKNDSNICTFFDESKKKCSIYQNRPFDCRAYPFDILSVDGKYCWIVYSCNPESNWKWAETYLQKLEQDKQIKEVMQKIDIFAGHTSIILPKESKKTPFTILREVRC